jgi:hypothetical protein
MAKRKRRSARLYLEAHQRAYAWANKALAYRLAGKVVQAKAAAKKSYLWLRRALALKR